jgi:hypothetical protein
MAGEIGFVRYFKREMDKTDEERKLRLRKRMRDPRTELVDHVADLRADLGRAALLLEALLDICAAKGVFTAEELQPFIEKADWRDSVMDGKLDPSHLRSTTPRDEVVPKTPEDYLKKLEETD